MAITGKDINKMKAVFATRDDLRKLSEVFVTKSEFNEFKGDMLDFKNDYLGFRDEMINFRDGMESYKKTSLDNMDFIFKKLMDIDHELKAFMSLYKGHDLTLEKHELRLARLEAAGA